MDELNRKMASGAVWMAMLRVSVRLVGLVSTMILARLLVPSDFGLVSMAMSVLAFLELATSFNFDIPLIQNQQADSRHFDSAWTLTLLFYTALTVLLLLLAQPAAAFYHEPRLTAVIYVLAGGFLAKGFENIGVVHFRKDLHFHKDFILMFGKKLVSVVITVPLAFYLRSYWALVVGIVVGNVLGVILTYVVHPFRPRLSLVAAGEMLSFSKWLVLNNGFAFLRVRSSDFVVGRISGSSALGLFNLAFEISTLPTTELVAPINRAVFPGYAKLAGSVQALKDSYLDVLAIVAFVAIPASFGISATSDLIVDVFLGERWANAAPLVAMLAIFGGLNAIQTNSGSVFNARGKPYLISFVALVNVVLLLGSCIPLALKFGPAGVAAGYVGSYLVLAPLTYYMVYREVQAGFRDHLKILWRPALASLIMFGVVGYVRQLIDARESLSSIEQLAILVITGACTYAAVALVLWYGSGRPRSPEYRLGLAVLRKLGATGPA